MKLSIDEVIDITNGKPVKLEPKISCKEAIDSIIRQNEMIIKQNDLIVKALTTTCLFVKANSDETINLDLSHTGT